MGGRTHGKDTATVLSEIKKIHGEKFLYDRFEYTNSKTKVIIGCYIHGYFEKYPNDLKRHNGGCPRCNNSFSKTDDDFRKELANKYPNLCYSGIYQNAKTPLTFMCSNHAATFTSKPNTVLLGHTGCKECSAVKQTNTRVQKGQISNPLLKTDYENYCRAVWRYSNRTYKQFLSEQKRDRQNHLDHILSIVEGFKNNVSPEIMGSTHNLRIISGQSNRRKSHRSDITVKELLERYFK